MSFFSALFYDKVMQYTEEACLIEWRRVLLENVDGNVLEIGAGTGASLGLYPSKSSLTLYLAEPDQHMRMQLQQKLQLQSEMKATVLSCSTESIEADDADPAAGLDLGRQPAGAQRRTLGRRGLPRDAL